MSTSCAFPHHFRNFPLLYDKQYQQKPGKCKKKTTVDHGKKSALPWQSDHLPVPFGYPLKAGQPLKSSVLAA